MPTPVYDAAMAFGGGMTPEGALFPRTEGRLDMAAAMVVDGSAERLILSGSAPFDRDDSLPSEAEIMRLGAIDRGVKPDSIDIETKSRMTIGNACLVKLGVTDPNPRMRHLTVVTNNLYRLRTGLVVNHVFGIGTPDSGYHIDVKGVRDTYTRRDIAQEILSLAMTKHFLAGTKSGDATAILARSAELHPRMADDASRAEILTANLEDLKTRAREYVPALEVPRPSLAEAKARAKDIAIQVQDARDRVRAYRHVVLQQQ